MFQCRSNFLITMTSALNQCRSAQPPLANRLDNTACEDMNTSAQSVCGDWIKKTVWMMFVQKITMLRRKMTTCPLLPILGRKAKIRWIKHHPKKFQRLLKRRRQSEKKNISKLNKNPIQWNTQCKFLTGGLDLGEEAAAVTLGLGLPQWPCSTPISA